MVGCLWGEQVAAGYVLHVGTMSKGVLRVGNTVSTEVDYIRRQRIVPNHTFTHVLNFALREVRTSTTGPVHARIQSARLIRLACSTIYRLQRTVQTANHLAILELALFVHVFLDLCVQVLGDHVDQKGSIVQPERLRFDFSHNGVIDGPTLGKIEDICNEQLAANLQIYERETPLADAKQINGEPSVSQAFQGHCLLSMSHALCICDASGSA